MTFVDKCFCFLSIRRQFLFLFQRSNNKEHWSADENNPHSQSNTHTTPSLSLSQIRLVCQLSLPLFLSITHMFNLRWNDPVSNAYGAALLQTVADVMAQCVHTRMEKETRIICPPLNYARLLDREEASALILIISQQGKSKPAAKSQTLYVRSSTEAKFRTTGLSLARRTRRKRISRKVQPCLPVQKDNLAVLDAGENFGQRFVGVALQGGKRKGLEKWGREKAWKSEWDEESKRKNDREKEE